MSEEHPSPNSSFSDVPIGPAQAPPADRDLMEIRGPTDGDRDDVAADPPYPFSTFSLFGQIRSSQADARDLLGL